jgi:hypothetical protein
MKIAAFPLYLHQPKLATGRECKCQKIKLKGSTIRKLRHTIYAVFCYSNPTHLTGPRLREGCEVTGHRWLKSMRNVRVEFVKASPKHQSISIL